MPLQNKLQHAVSAAILNHYQLTLNDFEFQATRQDFEGDITLVVFTLLRHIKGNPVQIGETIGAHLKENNAFIADFNVVKGFLNIVITDTFYNAIFNAILADNNYGISNPNPDEKAVMVEYSSPNTNKPLHLGHIRNNLLGYSVAKIIEASGKKVIKTQIINDRGIHICKSMLAWQKFGNGETPESTGLKGDKLVGNYYVKFDQEYKKQIAQAMANGLSEEEAKKQAPLLIEAQNMLKEWEAGNTEVVSLWKKMNQWVYDGFDISYKTLGVDFDINYYESNTYLLGKDVVAKGLKDGVFYKKEDSSVWIDLTDEGLDEKIVLRADGTAVYMTQDIGTAIQRFKDYDIDSLVYTVGNEQDYHFKVLILILKKLGYDWADRLYHLSYGMVDLPSGKMKSREGTVVDADDLIVEMTQTAKNISEELGKLEGYTDTEKKQLYKTIGLGALKYFILKVDPKKRILFDPAASIDFNGNTGPFIQYTYARIQSILRKATFDYSQSITLDALNSKTKDLIKHLQLFTEIISLAATNHSPALIANYTYDLVKLYNSFYQSVHILSNDNLDEKIVHVQVSHKVAQVIKTAFGLLGIDVPERM
ncbi:MAG: arginine--tRNA ligase [Flavobacteriaceae bacterium]|nr:arginine--tRNA ligase [Flavobacteriaceae bacterium]